jgi:ubiquinone/menaquinone biosynthesis C-methylase UbiE
MSTDNPKEIVKQAYDALADWYLSYVLTQPSPRERYALKVLDNISQTTPSSSPSHILELGCGPGVPITRLLLDRGAAVTANDISPVQISMAKVRCPTATFHLGDMTTLTFPPSSFSGVTCFYTLFHLPRPEQKTMLVKIREWLKPGGMFVFNLAADVDEDEIYGEMMGHGMFWSCFGMEESVEMVREAGLELVEAKVIEAGEGKLEESDPDYGVEFLWITARKGLSEV